MKGSGWGGCSKWGGHVFINISNQWETNGEPQIPFVFMDPHMKWDLEDPTSPRYRGKVLKPTNMAQRDVTHFAYDMP